MPALDTNVLVRFLVQDDAAQLAAAQRLINRCVQADEPLFVPVTVTLELEWVLRSNFKRPKVGVLSVLSDLLSTRELTFESEGAIEVALRSYADGTADFSDCVHTALAIQAGYAPLWTFDKAAAKVEGASLLT
ncbi:PIN domain-containing protein [Derxia lacustris]|uniref:PIN domain-containing protein n=1 Tax=Derxia lacustris TaxID=764842 RepID=UPI000A1758CF|nr:type II toxin-antitoxin system VapC family toxin [Derxia lacustris]